MQASARERVAEGSAAHPARFSGLASIDPFRGMQGLRDLEAAVKRYGFVGAHAYPHWFGLAPDDAKYYPHYAKYRSVRPACSAPRASQPTTT